MSYSSRSEILNGIACLKVMHFQPLMNISAPLVRICSKTALSRNAMNFAIRHTTFRHFCGGDTLHEVQKKLIQLENSGIRGIVDYAAEAPLVINAGGKPVIDYSASVDRTVKSIDFLCQDSNTPMLATKMTGIMDTRDLLLSSELIKMGHEAFRCFATGSSDFGKQFCQPVDYQSFGQMSMTFDSYYKACVANRIEPIDRLQFDHILGYTRAMKHYAMYEDGPVLQDHLPRTSGMEFDEFQSLVADYLLTTDLHRSDHPAYALLAPVIKSSHSLSGVQDIKSITMSDGNKRLHTILNALEYHGAKISAVSDRVMPFVLMDAESNDIQPAIDLITNHHARKVNRPGAILFGNTYQHYLKETHSRMTHDYYVNQRYGIPFAAKMVRGAYMNQDQRDAAKLSRPSPINDTIQQTHDSYNRAIEFSMDKCHHGDMRVVFGTHNEVSAKLVLDKVGAMARDSGPFHTGSITLAQLLGMSDSLASAIVAKRDTGILAGKYVPYGPIDLVIPYLLRRLEENQDAASRVKSDESYLKWLLRQPHLWVYTEHRSQHAKTLSRKDRVV